jgi:hypothetical protein
MHIHNVGFNVSLSYSRPGTTFLQYRYLTLSDNLDIMPELVGDFNPLFPDVSSTKLNCRTITVPSAKLHQFMKGSSNTI